MKPQVVRLLRIAMWVMVGGFLVLFATRVQWGETWNALRSASPSLLLLAAAVNLLSLVLKGVRWWIFLRPVGADSLWLAMRATFAGAGLNNVLVANGGEAARVIFVSRASHVPSARILATFALERLFELSGYVLMLVLGIWLLPLPGHISALRPFAITALATLGFFVLFLLSREKTEERVTEDATTWRGRLRAYARRFTHTLASVSTVPRFAAAMLLSIGAWGLQIATYQLTAEAVHFPITFTGTVACLLAVNVGFALRPTPGNVGVFQLLYALTAAALGFDSNAAVAVAFLIQTQQILPVTAIGVLMAPEFLRRRRTAGQGAAVAGAAVNPLDLPPDQFE
ncbi:MAG TPA: lysylphosphatidylglycerol synthase transmembrane domain-containing protein [Gemmatimonadaceae bacterium]|nr:lysylphosphatidylglycerol synthase transmembrane domain-containing protein [Gemmatimonadaceae bacterium]